MRQINFLKNRSWHVNTCKILTKNLKTILHLVPTVNTRYLESDLNFSFLIVWTAKNKLTQLQATKEGGKEKQKVCFGTILAKLMKLHFKKTERMEILRLLYIEVYLAASQFLLSCKKREIYVPKRESGRRAEKAQVSRQKRES